MRDSNRRWSAVVAAIVAASALAACNGTAGTGNGATAGPNVMPQVSQFNGTSGLRSRSLSPVSIYPGEVWGADNLFIPGDGDTKTGGQGQKVAGVTCDKTEHTNSYHIHFFVGVIYKDHAVALPDAIGMMTPGAENNGYISTAGCFYWIHTHDASGMMHIEDPRSYPPTDVLYRFSTALSIWGQTYSANNFGRLTGPVHVFIGNVSKAGQTTVSKYTAYTGSLGSIPLRTHEVIWVEVSTPYFTATQLPAVTFYTEY
ncbi:MAG: hypothetical protein JO199_09240 [Candidatus Eremiobacteraeota bacterium]|nr:hypothetical protein [Candidatus Eremiobacteraeota bacterium]